MLRSRPAPTATAPPRRPASRAAARLGITVYGCGADEAAVFREVAPGLGVVPTLTGAALAPDTAALASGNRCVSIGHKTRLMPATLDALADAGVRYVGTRSVGHDHVDLDHARSVGICVETVDYSPDSVADHTLMLMLMVVRRAGATVRRVAQGDYRLPDVRARELRDLTVGVVGTGRIGVAVIDRLGGFGCRVLAHDRRPRTAAEHVSLDELLDRSDLVTLHTPLTSETRHLLDGARIARMRPGAFVVNTARGGLVDTDALLAALRCGRLGGAALDVVEGEEGIFYADRRRRPVEHGALRQLQALPNVVITPHTAYFTEHALRDMVEHTLVNCLAFAAGDDRA